ncbi:MAG: ADP-forming succinate--CoA ligase subunit beta, partial [Alphaproteobacteria bacterium]|nr:ADP-forming succinate--CoA ligase subunit beta [Alphaproteobacteria bacterium]
MNIHEHQAKQVLAKYGVAVPRGQAAFSVAEARHAAEALGGPIWIVKAQIHAGGRGKAGGVKIAKSLDEVDSLADEILGKVLVTHQTGPAGREVKRLYIEEGCDIARELYLGAVVDRGSGRVAMMASTEGGVEIEAVAAETPEKIVTVAIDPAIGLQPFYARELAFGLGLEGGQVAKAVGFITALYDAMLGTDASMVEINPLVVTGSGDLIALDAKMNFDDNGLYRHPEIAELRDPSEEDAAELEATEADLSYIKLDGNIGCMVNGAGLAMAT